MSVLFDKINSDLKKSMQEKDNFSVSVLRLLLSSVKNKEISLREGSRVDLDDNQIIEVIKSEIKKRKDSIEMYRQGNRLDLVDKEEKEVEILEKYLPPQMGEEELGKLVRQVIGASGEVSQKDFGRIIGQVIAKTKGQADGSRVSAIVKKIFLEK